MARGCALANADFREEEEFPPIKNPFVVDVAAAAAIVMLLLLKPSSLPLARKWLFRVAVIASLSLSLSLSLSPRLSWHKHTSS